MLYSPHNRTRAKHPKPNPMVLSGEIWFYTSFTKLSSYTKNEQSEGSLLKGARNGWCLYLEANDQKFKKKEGDTATQLRKAMAVADINLLQWFTSHLSKSFPMRTVIPADAQAAAKVRVDVICASMNAWVISSFYHDNIWKSNVYLLLRCKYLLTSAK